MPECILYVYVYIYICVCVLYIIYICMNTHTPSNLYAPLHTQKKYTTVYEREREEREREREKDRNGERRRKTERERGEATSLSASTMKCSHTGHTHYSKCDLPSPGRRDLQITRALQPAESQTLFVCYAYPVCSKPHVRSLFMKS